MKKAILLLVVLSLLILIINFTQAQTETRKAPMIPIYYADGKPVANGHIVIGQIAVPAGSSTAVEELPVTLSNPASFSSADTYKCFAGEPFGAGLLKGGLFRNVDGSQFVFRTPSFGPAWQQDFFCVGN